MQIIFFQKFQNFYNYKSIKSTNYNSKILSNFFIWGICINELPSETPQKLKKLKEYIFYENINDLKN